VFKNIWGLAPAELPAVIISGKPLATAELGNRAILAATACWVIAYCMMKLNDIPKGNHRRKRPEWMKTAACAVVLLIASFSGPMPMNGISNVPAGFYLLDSASSNGCQVVIGVLNRWGFTSNFVEGRIFLLKTSSNALIDIREKWSALPDDSGQQESDIDWSVPWKVTWNGDIAQVTIHASERNVRKGDSTQWIYYGSGSDTSRDKSVAVSCG
jgi:hypothetical protein